MTTVALVRDINKSARKDLSRVTSKSEGFLASARDQDFGVFFSRDAAVSSIFALDIIKNHPNYKDNEKLLRNVRKSLITMALYQGKTFDTWRDEEPGKIAHEIRHERIPKNQQRLADLKASGWPVEGKAGSFFMRYHGSVDATPLFVIVACDYLELTKDKKMLKMLSPTIQAGISWMKRYGDLDDDLYIEFSAKNRKALLNQGWKDSEDSIKDPNGLSPKEPIALVEVQGYQYEALVKASKLYGDIDPQLSESLADRAKELKAVFNRDFWMEDEGFFAYALDGDKRQIKDIASNVGHLLMTGIIDEEKLDRVKDRLMKPDLFTPYGIRTLSSKSLHFSDHEPAAYHNGSIWPHDNAIIAIGLKKHGYKLQGDAIATATLRGESILKRDFGIQNEELYMVDSDGKIRPYETAQRPQGWGVMAYADLTAS